MIKVKIIKQNDKEVEFTKTIELQREPKVKEELIIDGNSFVVRSIKQDENELMVTVKDKNFKTKRFW